jgi:hypothetical protein
MFLFRVPRLSRSVNATQRREKALLSLSLKSYGLPYNLNMISACSPPSKLRLTEPPRAEPAGHGHPVPDLQVDIPENHKGSCVRSPPPIFSPPILALIEWATNCHCPHLVFSSTPKTNTARAWPTASLRSPRLHNRTIVDINGKLDSCWSR